MVGAGQETGSKKSDDAAPWWWIMRQNSRVDQLPTALLTILVVGDGDGDDVVGAHHGAAPVVSQRRAEVHLELLLRLEHGVVVDVNAAVLHLRNKKKL